MTRPRLPLRLPLLAVALVAACDHAPTAAPRPQAPPAVQELVCEAVVSGGLSCAAPGASAGGARGLILGGQGSNVLLASSGNTYDGVGTYGVDVSVQNLIGQPLGTADGTAPHADGVRVFFVSEPVATGGSGVVSLANADGTDLFTASEQAYFRYDGVLETGETSAPRTWRFSLPSSVTSFRFRVYVAAAVPRPAGWVEIAPDLVDVAVGGARTLGATVRDVLGRPAAGTVTWASSDTTVAVVDTAGVVTGRTVGSAVITAVSGARSGMLALGVVDSGDVRAPVIRAVAVSPDSVDVSDAGAPVEVRVDVADAGVGVREVYAILDAPGSLVTHACGAAQPASGTMHGGTWRCTVTLPRNSAPGAWRWRVIGAVDLVGNRHDFDTAQLEAAGFPHAVRVTSAAADTTRPALTGFTFAPQAVDVTLADDTVEVWIGASDAGSGVREVYTVIDAPGLAATRGCYGATLIAGTVSGGTWRCTVVIPRGSRPGTWSFRVASAMDSLNNRVELGTAELAAAGFATTVEVRSDSADVEAPVLTGFSVSPDSVNVSAAGADVQVEIGATDAGVGVQEVEAILDGPGLTTTAACSASRPVAGTPNGGTWRCRLAIPRAGASGVWRFRVVTVMDALQNRRALDAAGLEAAGWPATVHVSN